MTPFEMIKRDLSHNEIFKEKCHYCLTGKEICLYFYENIKYTNWGGLVWSCKKCLKENPVSPKFKIIIHKLTVQDIFTLRLILNNG